MAGNIIDHLRDFFNRAGDGIRSRLRRRKRLQPSGKDILEAQRLLIEIRTAELLAKQLDLGIFDQPQAYARKTDPDESWIAARSVTNIRRSQWEVYRALLEYGPRIDEELIFFMRTDGTKQSTSGIRTRRCELVRFGLVVPITEKQFTQYGNPSQVWRARPWSEWVDWLKKEVEERYNQ